MTTLGEQMRSARKAREWTQGELAGRVGASQYTISEIERDNRPGSSELRSRIAETLDIDLGTIEREGQSELFVPPPSDIEVQIAPNAAAAGHDDDEAAPAPPGSDEVAPQKPRLMDRFRSRRGRRSGQRATSTAPAERAPRKEKRKIGRRVALDADISDIWAFAGRRLEMTPHYPTGRMLQYQAPAAGVILDRAVAGSLPDRVILQPLARNRGKYEDVGFLLAGPILTFSLTTTMARIQIAADTGDQDAYNELTARLTMQREAFTWVLSMMLPRLAAGAKLAADKKAKRDAVIADAFPELGDDDPAVVLADMLFSPPTFKEAPSDNSRGTYTDATAGTGTTGAAADQAN